MPLAPGGRDQVFGLGARAPSDAGSDSATDSAAAHDTYVGYSDRKQTGVFVWITDGW
jgi:hypothetical protein